VPLLIKKGILMMLVTIEVLLCYPFLETIYTIFIR